MFKVKLSSNFFISLTAIVALGVVGCGGSGNGGSGTGGHGGTAGSAGKGTGGTGAIGGAGGGKGGTGGSVGGSGGGTGGAVGGAGGGTGGGTGGAGTGGAAGAGGGGGNRCGETVVCVIGAFRCNAGAPQQCQADPTPGTMMGCPFWGTTPGQPASCSANQACDATSGTCKCKDDPACGTPPTAGDFCPTQGGATHSSCNQGADGCFTVTSGTACAAGMTCQTTTAGAVVPAGTACGCAPAPSDPSGKTVALNGTGCTMADATAGTRVGSAKDDAILTCKATAGGCYTWQITTSCTSQQLTGGTDPVTSLPACVCKTPAVANQYYVDPDPEMSTFMTGQPTGAQFPAACRFRTLTTAFAQKGVTEVIAQHTTSSNVHFKTKAGSPGVSNCNAPNSCEVFPMDIPAGVHVYTSDQGSFNPLHYVIDVDATTSAGYAVKLNDKAFFEGYTVDASGTNGSGVNAGTNVIAVVSSPITGAWTSTQAAAPITGKLNQILILSKNAGLALNEQRRLVRRRSRRRSGPGRLAG